MTDNERMGRLLAANHIAAAAQHLERLMSELFTSKKNDLTPEIKLSAMRHLIVTHAKLLAEIEHLKKDIPT